MYGAKNHKRELDKQVIKQQKKVDMADLQEGGFINDSSGEATRKMRKSLKKRGY